MALIQSVSFELTTSQKPVHPLGGTGRAHPHTHRYGLRDTFGSLPYFYGQFLYAASYFLFGSEVTTFWYS